MAFEGSGTVSVDIDESMSFGTVNSVESSGNLKIIMPRKLGGGGYVTIVILDNEFSFDVRRSYPNVSFDTTEGRKIVLRLPEIAYGGWIAVYEGGTRFLIPGKNPQKVPVFDRERSPSERARIESAQMDRDSVSDMIAVSNAQTDTKLAELRGDMKLMFSKMDDISRDIAASRAEAAANARDIKNANSTSRLTIIVTVVGSMLAALGVLLATQANMLSAFQTGMSAKPSAADAPSPPSGPPARSGGAP